MGGFLSGLKSLSAGGDKSASANYGDISSRNTVGGSFPFGSPSSNNTLLILGVGAIIIVLAKRRKK